jgi:RecB family exonuclease
MHLSYSRISTYMACPYRYYLQYVVGYRPPLFAAASFGSSLHLALQGFHSLGPPAPRLDQLLAIYVQRWKPYGYRSREEEARYFEEGLQILHVYYLRNLFGYRPAWMVEKRFSVSIGGNEFVGIVDRVDGEPGQYQVVDYKTSLREKTLDSLQLPLYAISLGKMFGTMPEGLSYYFLREQVSAPWSGEPGRLEEAEEVVVRIGERIRRGHFPPRIGISCRSCDLRRVCQVRPPTVRRTTKVIAGETA